MYNILCVCVPLSVCVYMFLCTCMTLIDITAFSNILSNTEKDQESEQNSILKINRKIKLYD